jgi:C-terminal processing protease CtpA/Prc
MKEAKANWRDDEMNRIIMEMRERFQSEMNSAAFIQALSKKQNFDSRQSMSNLPISGDTIGTDGRDIKSPQAIGGMDATSSQVSGGQKSPAWNNTCSIFLSLRVVVWKHHFMPSMTFDRHPATGIWNMITQVDADESFGHISVGDALTYINGRPVDSIVQNQDDLNDIFAACPSPLILKFEAKEPDNEKVHDYTVTWSNGPLGVTLKDDCTSQKVPIVNRLTKKAGSVAVKQNIAVGDILVAINNIDTIQLGSSLSMSILKKVQLPAKLRFRGVGGPMVKKDTAEDKEPNTTKNVEQGAKPVIETNMSMSRPSKYTIHWGEGPLGLTIIPGLNDGDLPVIKKVTGTGTSKGIEKAQVGDLLQFMNDIPTSSMPFEEVVAYLKSAPKPVILKFKSDFGSVTDSFIGTPMLQSPTTSFKTEQAESEQVAASLRSMELKKNSSLINAPDNRKDVYEITWGTGPLGLTIDASPNNAAGAYIKRMAAQGAASQLSQDCIGDVLIYINDKDTTRIMFQDIVDHLKKCPRPVKLVFQRKSKIVASSTSHTQAGRLTDTVSKPGRAISNHEGPHYYNLVWQDGTSLGLSLRAADHTCDYPFITRVTGSGSAAHLPDSVVGDCLVSVEGRSVHTRDRSFEDVMAMLKAMPKPITLKFQARNKNSASRVGSSANPRMSPAPSVPYRSDVRQNSTQPKSRGSAGAVVPPPAPFENPYSMLQPDFGRSQSSSVQQSRQGSNNRSFGGSDRALDISSAVDEEKFSSIQAPFLGQAKLSAGRRQKMLKGLKK